MKEGQMVIVYYFLIKTEGVWILTLWSYDKLDIAQSGNFYMNLLYTA